MRSAPSTSRKLSPNAAFEANFICRHVEILRDASHSAVMITWTARQPICYISVDPRPRGLSFSWWGRYGLCLRYKPTELVPSLFLFFSCVCFCRYSPFNCISFHKVSRQLSAFSLCSSCLNSALLAHSTIYILLKVSLSPDTILCG